MNCQITYAFENIIISNLCKSPDILNEPCNATYLVKLKVLKFSAVKSKISHFVEMQQAFQIIYNHLQF